MSIPLFLISFLGLLIFIVLGIVSKFKKNGKAKRNFIISGACFVIMIVSFASIPTSEADKASTEVKDSVNDQESEDIEKEQSKEPELTEEEKAKIEQAKAEEEAKKKAEEEAKAKAEAEAKAKAEEEARLKAEQEAAARKEKAVANAKEISFPMLDKAANRYAGEPYYIKGEVIQAIEDGNYTIMRINMTQDTHGGTDPGAVANGLLEKYITLAISLKISQLLMEYEDVQVKMSRDDDSTVSLKKRTDMANAWGADYLVSIHINAGGGEGYEDFIYTSSSTKSVAYQNVMHDEIVKPLGMRDRGKKRGNLHMVRESKMPAILTESGFIDNARDAAKLKQSAFIDKIAHGHVDGLVKIFGLKRKQATPKPQPTDKLYRVQVGAFSVKANAEKLAAELKSKGYPTIIVE